MTELRVVLQAGLQLIAFRRLRRFAGRLGGRAVITVILLGIVVNCAAHYLSSGAIWPRFNAFGLSAVLAELAVSAAVILLLRGRHALRLGWALSLLVIIGASGKLIGLVIERSVIALWHHGYTPTQWWNIFGTCIGVIVLLMVAWAIRAGRSLWRGDGRWPGLTFAVAAFAPLLVIPAQPMLIGPDTTWQRIDIWYAYELFLRRNDKQNEYDDYFLKQTAVEDTLYRQPSLMAHTLGSVMPSEGNRPQYFLLAAAPNGTQDVFAHEVTSVQQLFDERFGTRGHSAVLITSAQTLDTVPLADTKNIAVALQEFGRLMDRERDVLVLFITSHGADGFVSVDLDGYPLNQITPDGLAKALDDANIKNRVLIISACHSGSFVPRLKNDDTLIMTAARADRTSFGCGNGRQWTYFGDALFNHALRETRSFVAGFQMATGLISDWEQRLKDQEASEPQISVGKNIAKLLDDMARNGESATAAQTPN